MSWLKRNGIILAMVFLGIIAGVGSFLYMGDLLEPHKQVVKAEKEKPEVKEPKIEKKENKEQERWLELPRKRNLIVLIDNDKNARPQAGLQEADLVYELPIEGGTTRLMAVFSRFDAQLIGPIRSARDYIIDLAKEHDPIFVHAGGSPQAFAKFNEIGNLNGLAGGVDRAFWRIKEREAPHNLYSDTETLRRVARQECFREKGQLPDLKYLTGTEKFIGKEANKIGIVYGHPDFRAEYFYDEESSNYLRFTGGVKHFTPNSEQIAVKNIIIQKVNTKVKDKEKRLQVDLVDKGRAVFFTRGKFIEGYWEKKPGGITQYFQADGEEIKLTPGNTWINIVPLEAQIVY